MIGDVYCVIRRELVRKKACMALVRFMQLDIENSRDLAPLARKLICDKSPCVMAVALDMCHMIAKVRWMMMMVTNRITRKPCVISCLA